jgi:hypothetical protein
VEVGGDEAPAPRPGGGDVGQGQRPARGQPDAGATGVRLGILKPGLYAMRSGRSSRPRPGSRPRVGTRSWRS